MLTLFEELQILSIHEAKGAPIRLAADRLKPGLAGAVLTELAILEKIQATENHRLHLLDDSPVKDDVFLNEILGILKEAEKERKFGYWINALAPKAEKFSKRITEGLIRKGIVTQDDDRLAWMIPAPEQEEAKMSAKYRLVRRLRDVVLAQEDFSLRDIALLGLLRACGLLDLVFLRDERKLAGQFIYELEINQALQYPVIQTIQEIEAAVAAMAEED